MTLDTIIFNGFTLGRMLFWLSTVAVFVLLLKIYKFIFGTKKVRLQHTVYHVFSRYRANGSFMDGHPFRLGLFRMRLDEPQPLFSNPSTER